MKYKRLLLIFFVLLTGMVINSCKKENQSAIQMLFTGGSWELASVLVFNYTGNTLVSTDTLNTNCSLSQYFTFSTNGTCTYTHFDCLQQPTAQGTWALTANQLYLQSNIVCKDTTAAGSSKPFSYASIQNLGEYSLVLYTGDIQPNYSLTQPRKVIQYGFIRETNPQ